MSAQYSIEERGKLYTESYRAYFKNEFGDTISPFHDIPLKVQNSSTESEQSGEQLFNMVVEVPRWTNAKMEISKGLEMNPIVQDVKKGKVRFVGNVFPHKGYIWNYGAMPQTWEDPRITHEGTNATGDNDPLDVCDISSTIVPRGSVIQVKVLGILAMIDEGETDWKVIAINNEDPIAQHMSDIGDVEKYMPGLLHATLEWFKYYKVPDGKPLNAFGYNNKFRNREFALSIVEETHQQWYKLIGGEEEKISDEDCDGIKRQSVSVNESPYLVVSEDANGFKNESEEYDVEPAPVEDSKATESYFVRAAQVPSAESVVVVNIQETTTIVETVTVEESATEETTEMNGEANGEAVTVTENGDTQDATQEEAAKPEEPAATEDEPMDATGDSGAAAEDKPAEEQQ